MEKLINKPRLAIEVKLDGEVAYTKYFNIDKTKEIIQEIVVIQNQKHHEINRFYYANNYGNEIEWKGE